MVDFLMRPDLVLFNVPRDVSSQTVRARLSSSDRIATMVR